MLFGNNNNGVMKKKSLDDVNSKKSNGNTGPTCYGFSSYNRDDICYLSFVNAENEVCIIDMKEYEEELIIKSVIDEKWILENSGSSESRIKNIFWSNDGKNLLVLWNGNVYMVNMELENSIKCIMKDAIDAEFSPDNKWISFVKNNDIYVYNIKTEVIEEITCDGSSVIHNGVADFLAQEEMDRYRGYWWHPSSNGIVFIRVDESEIPPYRIIHQTNLEEEIHRYPFAGKDNPKVYLGYASLNRDVLWLKAPREASEYIARVNVLKNGNIIAQWQNRLQNVLIVMSYDVQTGHGTMLLKETSDTWINLHNMFESYGDNYFIFASERSGYSHLYLYEQDTCVRALSNGEWVVESIVGLDDNYVYVTGTYDSPLERHLYALSLHSTSDPIRLTKPSGMHSFIMDSKCTYIIDTHSDIHRPTTIQVHKLLPTRCRPSLLLLFTLFDSSNNNNSDHLTLPQLISFPTTDGSHTLHACLYTPDTHRFGPGPYPLICSVYGGPHVQRVSRSYTHTTADIRAQRLRSLGFAVLKCDNRGSSRRGKHFESIIYKQLGKYEVIDQVTAVRYLTIRGVANPNQVGIYGWSYGGYLAAMCLARAPDVFHAAVAGAPVSSWDGYDTHYTERYMSLPTTNITGYTHSSLFHHVPNIKGQILILHGLIDENVHFRHTARLVNYFINHDKKYELVIFPEERHSPKKLRDRVYMEQRISDFFVKCFRNIDKNRILPGHL